MSIARKSIGAAASSSWRPARWRARQTAPCVATYGDTVVLCTAVGAKVRADGHRLLPADGRLPGEDLRRGQDPRRLLQARRPAEREGDPDLAPDRPPDPPALPRRASATRSRSSRTVLSHDQRERPRHPRDDRRLGRADRSRTSPSSARSAPSASATSTASIVLNPTVERARGSHTRPRASPARRGRHDDGGRGLARCPRTVMLDAVDVRSRSHQRRSARPSASWPQLAARSTWDVPVAAAEAAHRPRQGPRA